MATKDNVEVINGFYYPENDYLKPNMPRIDWGGSEAAKPTPVPTYSNAGGLGFEEPAISANDINLAGIMPARQRSNWGTALAADMIDAYNMAIGMQGAYVGQTAKRMSERELLRQAEDPEGKAIDENRAKVLSLRAAATNDPELKKKYGAAIKMLLPRETQGLDDLTASDFFNSTDNKLKLEQLKAYNKLQQIAAQNKGKLELAGVNNASREAIATEKVNAQLQMNALDNQIKQAVAEGKNDTALQLQGMKGELQTYIHQLDNAADMEREIYKQGAATERTNIQQGGANWRAQLSADTSMAKAQLQADAALERVRAQQEGAVERARIMQDGALARAQISGAKKATAPESTAAFAMKVDTDSLRNMKTLNDSAGRWDTNAYNPSDSKQGYWSRLNVKAMAGEDYGVATADNSKRAQEYQRFEGLAKQIVQDQLRKIYGSQFTEKEGERFFQSMGLSPVLNPSVRWDLFMNAINDLRVKNGYPAIDSNSLQSVDNKRQEQQSDVSNKQQGKRVF